MHVRPDRPARACETTTVYNLWAPKPRTTPKDATARALFTHEHIPNCETQMLNIHEVVADLAAYGLATEPWMPRRGEGNDKSPIGGGKLRPIVKVTDLAAFREFWPNAEQVVMSGLNGGQSTRVKLQAVIRSAVEHDHAIKDDDLVAKQLNALLGVRAPTSPAKLSDDALLEEARKRGLIS